MAGLDALQTVLLGSLGLQRGWQQNTAPGQLPAGTDFAHAVPGDAWERLIFARFTLVTSAAVGNRSIAYSIQDERGNYLLRLPLSGGDQAASLTKHYNVSQVPYSNILDTFFVGNHQPVPDAILPAGWVSRFEVVGIDVADVVTVESYVVQRFATSAVAQLGS